MLRIGKLTDYALLILSQMVKDPQALMSASALAEILRLTTPTVSKILKILADAKLVTSVRGVDGGYRLARAGNSITVADIIIAMEGEFAMTECCESISLCSIDSACKMRENWQKINKMVHALLSKFTIIDMTGPLSIISSLESTTTGSVNVE